MSQLEQASVVTLSDLVSIQEGSIVSRTLCKAAGGNQSLFAFAAGQGLSEHTAPFDATVQVIQGEALVTIDGKEMTVAAGQLVLMPANVPHALKAEQSFVMLLTMLKQG
ncbi:MAG: cupin domain-containing protein [Candidatus Cloacimonetes bacterium]|nr:cupin domain-containing protein [Candidatus Cloacimonadota bacterium]